MTPKVLLSPLDGSGASSGAKTAAELAKVFGAHLILMHVAPDARDAVPLVGEGMSGALIDEIVRATEEDSAQRLQRASETRKDLNLEEAEWLVLSGREDEEIALRGRMADLIILSRNAPSRESAGDLSLHAALFETGKPVLLVGKEALIELPKRIAVSWNGSIQAARAVAAALPFLVNAEAVTILNAKADVPEPVNCDALVSYLAAHGIAASINSFQPEGAAVGASLLEHAKAVEADFMVMGAYTHSRMRQLILGGVTSHILAYCDLPVLLAH